MFDFVIESGSSYYQRVIKVLFALFEDHKPSMIDIKSIKNRFLEESESDIFKKLLNGRSIIFPEIMPFHSESFKLDYSKVNTLRNTYSNYNDYCKNLFSFIEKNIESNGLIIGNGSPTSKYLFQMLKNVESELLIDNYFISLFNWDSKWTVLFKQQLFNCPHGLQSHSQVDKIFNMIRKIINCTEDICTLVQELNQYCEDIYIDRVSKKNDKKVNKLTKQLQQSKKRKVKINPVVIKDKDNEPILTLEQRLQITNTVIDILNEKDAFKVFANSGSKIRFAPKQFECLPKWTESKDGKIPIVHYELDLREKFIRIALKAFDVELESSQKVINNIIENTDIFNKYTGRGSKSASLISKNLASVGKPLEIESIEDMVKNNLNQFLNNSDDVVKCFLSVKD